MQRESRNDCNNIDRIPDPHGGSLVDLVIDTKKMTDDMYFVNIDDNLRNDVENIGYGIFSPLNGFVGKEDFESILTAGRLKKWFAMDHTYHSRCR
jgi:ATP sulfurylase